MQFPYLILRSALPSGLTSNRAAIIVVLTTFEAFWTNTWQRTPFRWRYLHSALCSFSLSLTFHSFCLILLTVKRVLLFFTSEGDLPAAIVIMWSLSQLSATFGHQKSLSTHESAVIYFGPLKEMMVLSPRFSVEEYVLKIKNIQPLTRTF